MAPRSSLRKVVDDETVIRCTIGFGLLREEVWEDATGKVVRYNLAFINHFMTPRDNGRVLGYDNCHGYHHRHLKGEVEAFEFVSHDKVRERFAAEVQLLRKEKL